MSKLLPVSFLLLALAFGPWHASAAPVEITGFGSSTQNPLMTSDFASPWTGTIGSNSASVSNVSNSSGGIDVPAPIATPVNITTSDSLLTLTGALTSADPTTDQFQLELFDSNGGEIDYNFDWSSFAGGTQTVSASIAADSGFDGTVDAYALTLFGSPTDSVSTVSFTFDNLEAGPASVPEPSTYALLMMGLGFIGFYFRRRRAVLAVVS